MSTVTTTEVTDTAPSPRPEPPLRAVSDEGRIGLRANLRPIGALARRNVLQIKQDPESMFDVLLMPIVFTLLFVFVFGGAVAGKGNQSEYVSYLVPGLMAMMGLNVSMAVGSGINEDFQKGVMDRFRTMPIARSSVLIAKIVVEVGRMMVAFAILLIVGFVLGMEIEKTDRVASAVRSTGSSRSHDQSTTARSVCCLGSTVRLPPVSSRKRSSRRSAICRGVSIRSRAAASSMASGSPSSRRQISSAATGSSSVRKPGRAAAPRSASSRSASTVSSARSLEPPTAYGVPSARRARVGPRSR
ncbi:Daunorubicin/doxorubicin resistance ABC transporter permease protein DrrB [Streptomyces sp. S4.7]|uniref:ABC transporter permease n=1 Tax=Streptomyces sp. S4.7 TaxID=2705439 RepID=UPI001396EBA5|nr:ABC transporter permease [Streptomyces sp. S4.7]QHY95212.1 Daunorubicin/doxorubicin resistance ABC transporter permease protein DrrB [Streptomyces sp. S4.7]